MKKLKSFNGAVFDASAPEGSIKAVFSTFGVIDRDGEVVEAGAIPEVEVPLVVAHNWSTLPVGKGRITTDAKEATFTGEFFIDTEHGRQAYLTAKAMGSLQQYSWAFDVLESEKGTVDKKAVNIIKKTEPFEVTLALVGVNRDTYTIGIKSADQKMYMDVPPAQGSYEELRDSLNSAFREQQFGEDAYGGYTCIVATYADRFVALLWKWTDEEDSYWEVPYGKDANGAIILGDPKQVQPQTDFVPIGKGMTFDEHLANVQVAVGQFIQRSKAGSAVRRKEGRAISTARRERLESVVTWLQDAAKEVQGLLDETNPSSEDSAKSARAVFAQFLQVESKLSELGVR